MKPIKMSNQYNKSYKQFIDEKLIDDLKKFKGLPPYDNWSNTCMSDGYFWADIQRRHTKSEIENAEKEIRKEN